jgi:hypothetical protein
MARINARTSHLLGIVDVVYERHGTTRAILSPSL